MPLFRLLACMVLLGGALSGGGCVSTSSTPEVQLLVKSPLPPICRIAVLPFVNHTDYDRGDLLVYRIFVAELNRRQGFTVVQEGDVRRIYRQMQLTPKESPGYEQTLVLADRLGVDALISGEIVAMHDEQRMKETEPVLAVDMKLLPAGATKPWLTSYHRRTGAEYRKVMHFGLVNTMTSLATVVSGEIVDAWLAKGLTPCGDNKKLGIRN